MTIGNVYSIAIPTYDLSVYNIEFKSVINSVTFQFDFQWFNDQWNGWCTFNGITRELAVTPYVLNWFNYGDYIIVFDNIHDEIARNDLISTTIWVFAWQ
jgi:hypothetical protein